MAVKRTIKEEVSLSGIGIHSGENVELFLKPSDSGKIILRRTDLKNLEMSIDPQRVKAKRGSSLETDAASVLTLEHLLASLYILGIDSVVVELNGGEIPIMDGSAEPFVQALQKAGIRPLPEQKRLMRVVKPHRIEGQDSYVIFSPYSEFKITYTIEYDHPLIKKQELSILLNVESFVKEIAPARTFGFLKEVPALLQDGLARGGSLANAVVLDDDGVMGGSLRFSDEFVRHKILDFVGDISLLGYPVAGHFKAYKAGHRLHLEAVRFLLDNSEYWTLE